MDMGEYACNYNYPQRMILMGRHADFTIEFFSISSDGYMDEVEVCRISRR